MPALSSTDGRIAGDQSEGSPGRAHFQNVARFHVIVQEGTGHAVHFLFDAHTISVCARRPRHRIVPQQRRSVRRNVQPQH